MDDQQFKLLVDEAKTHLEIVVYKAVNKKLDSIQKEVREGNQKQDEKIDEVIKNTKDVVDLYKTSIKLGNAVIVVSKFLGAVAVIVGAFWAFTKFVVMNVSPK